MTTFERKTYMDQINEVHLFFLLDTSGSMYGQRIQSLNMAMRNVAEKVEELATQKEVSALFHVLAFNDTVGWKCGTSATHGISGTELRQKWQDLDANGGTNTAAAIKEIIPALTVANLGHHTYRPLIVLVTDGESNRPAETVAAAKELSECFKTTRIAIGVVNFNQNELDSFACEGLLGKVGVFGETLGEPVLQKLVFPVADASKLGGVILAAGATSLVDNNRVQSDEPVYMPITVDEDDGSTGITGPDPTDDDDDETAI